MITLLLLVRATYIYGVVLHAHPVRGESHNQRNTTGEVATHLKLPLCERIWLHDANFNFDFILKIFSAAATSFALLDESDLWVYLFGWNQANDFVTLFLSKIKHSDLPTYSAGQNRFCSLDLTASEWLRFQRSNLLHHRRSQHTFPHSKHWARWYSIE